MLHDLSIKRVDRNDKIQTPELNQKKILFLRNDILISYSMIHKSHSKIIYEMIKWRHINGQEMFSK
jgi:hypothetical protein